MTSVKVRGLGKADLSKVIQRYLEDFQLAIGESPNNNKKFEKAADLILKPEFKKYIPESYIPDKIREISDLDEIKDYLKNHAELQIPSDHVKPVQDALREDIGKHPERYGFKNKKPTKGEIEKLTRRIKPLKFDTNTIEKIVKQVKEIKEMKQKKK